MEASHLEIFSNKICTVIIDNKLRMEKAIFTCKERKFFSHFGVHKATVVVLFLHLSSINSQIKMKHVFWGLYFLKVYSSTDTSSSYWHVDPKTYSYWVWQFLALAASLELVFKHKYSHILTISG